MRSKSFSVCLIIVLMIAQQTIIFGAARRNDNSAAILPRAGSVYVDALRNTRVLRVTDENDALTASVISTTSFNADGTRFIVNLERFLKQ